MSFVKMMMMAAMLSHYQVGDVGQMPSVELPPAQETGLASWYGDGQWHGDITANGEVFDPESFTCAHRSLPFDTMVLIVNKATRRRVWCRINDRGPYGARLPDGTWTLRLNPEGAGQYRGILDMTIATAEALGTIDSGLSRVELRYWTPASQPAFNLAAIDQQYQ